MRPDDAEPLKWWESVAVFMFSLMVRRRSPDMPTDEIARRMTDLFRYGQTEAEQMLVYHHVVEGWARRAKDARKIVPECPLCKEWRRLSDVSRAS